MKEIEKIADLTPWRVAFDATEDARLLSWRIDQMMPGMSDIFTGKLSFTRSYFGSIANGSVSVLNYDPQLNLQAAYDILRVLATHHRVARVGSFRLAAPGFWIRPLLDRTTAISDTRPRPVMPLTHLVALSGRDQKALNFLLRPLVSDGAVGLLRNTDGTEGIMLNDGFVCSARVQGLMRL